MTLHIEMAKESKSPTWFYTPIIETASASGLDVDVVLQDSSFDIKIPGTPAELAEVLAYEILDSLGISESLKIEVSSRDEMVHVDILAWESPEVETAEAIEVDDDDSEFEDDGEDEDPEDIDLEDDLEDDGEEASSKKKKKEKEKEKKKTSLGILNNLEGQKIVTRLYGISSGDDMSNFPSFWQEVDAMCAKYRGMSGYRPPIDEENSSVTDMEEAFAQEISSLHELAKSKKKKWKEGYSGFLSTFMSKSVGKRELIESLWTDLDQEKFVNLWISIGKQMVDALTEERDKRGLDMIEEKKEEELDTEE